MFFIKVVIRDYGIFGGKQAPQIEKWDKFFKYDPYFGTLPPGILERQWKEKYLKKPPEPTKINSN